MCGSKADGFEKDSDSKSDSTLRISGAGHVALAGLSDHLIQGKRREGPGNESTGI